jgi:hypothetical protein
MPTTPKAKKERQAELAASYAKKIRPLLDDAKRAYGSRTQASPAHRASRLYTGLLVEYYEKGGSIALLADSLGVTYAGIRRRITTAKTQVPAAPRRRGLTDEAIGESVARVRAARDRGTARYHAQLAKERELGVPLAAIAKGLGISNSAPLYYGVQRYYYLAHRRP